MKKVRIHAIVTGNDGTTGTKSPTFTNNFTLETLTNLISELKIIFGKAGIKLLFHPAADITEIQNAELNEDVPFENGKVKAIPKPKYPMNVDDLVNNPNVIGQRAFSENLTGNLVIFFRDFSAQKYSIGTNDKGNIIKAAPYNFSSSFHLYVRVTKGLESYRLAHEVGHYFHLGHTFSSHSPKTIDEASKIIKNAVESGKFDKSKGALVFDGDRSSGVTDTPPDPAALVAMLNPPNSVCGPVDSAKVPVKFSDGTTKTYTLKPDRLNMMSYWFSCMTTNSARFSSNQKKRMLAAIETGNRKHLINELPGQYTAVMIPGSKDERYVYGWKYDFFKMKYDELWDQGWRLHVLENYVHNNEVLYTAAFRKSNAQEIQLYGWSYNAYRKRYDELWDQGWRLYILNNYVIHGQVKYTAVFRKSTANEIQLYNWSYNAYRKKYDALWNDGWRLFILNNYEHKGQVKYTAVFRKSTAPEIQLYGWQYQSFRKEYDKLWDQGWRIHILNNYRTQGKIYYTAVFRSSNSNEVQLYNWKYSEFRERMDDLWDKNYRVKTLNVY